MLKACSRCGKIHPQGYRCQAGKLPQIKTNEQKLRSKSAWTKKSRQIRDDALNLCEVCLAQGIYNYKGLEVHHITKLSKDADGLLEDDNLICLCVEHHKAADAGELSADYLKELVKKRGKNA